jgi:hypothetical protein
MENLSRLEPRGFTQRNLPPQIFLPIETSNSVEPTQNISEIAKAILKIPGFASDTIALLEHQRLQTTNKPLDVHQTCAQLIYFTQEQQKVLNSLLKNCENYDLIRSSFLSGTVDFLEEDTRSLLCRWVEAGDLRSKPILNQAIACSDYPFLKKLLASGVNKNHGILFLLSLWHCTIKGTVLLNNVIIDVFLTLHQRNIFR